MLVALCAGAFFRFYQLDRQVVYEDELAQQLRVGGTSQRERNAFFDGRVHDVGEFERRFLAPKPNDAPKIVRALADAEPQWPPLSYLLEYGWERLVEPGIVGARALSGLIGLCTIAAMAWLAWELFGTWLASLLGATIGAFSPLDVGFDREARGYSLFLLLVAVGAAAVLRARRTNDPRWWALYGAIAVLGLYTDALFVAVLLGHAAWTLWEHRPGAGARSDLRPALAAFAVPLALAAPWFALIARGRHGMGDVLPTAAGYPLLTFVLPKWVSNVALSFFALHVWNVDLGWIAAVIAVLVGVAVVAVGRRRPAALIFLSATGVPGALALALVDAHLQKSLALMARYELPLWLALQLCVAGALAHALASTDVRRRIAAAAVGGVLLVGSGASSVATIEQPWWWESWYDAAVPAIVQRIDETPTPLIVTSRAASPDVVLASGLRADDRILPLPLDALDACRPVTVDATRPVFLLSRPGSLRYQPRVERDAFVIPAVISHAHASLAWRFREWVAQRTGRRPRSSPPDWWTTYELWAVVPRNAGARRLTFTACP